MIATEQHKKYIVIVFGDTGFRSLYSVKLNLATVYWAIALYVLGKGGI